MDKVFAIFKVGYSSGVYGCSGEYFQLVMVENNKITGMSFSGLYGSESRIADALKEKGYIYQYIGTGTYGKITGKDKKFFLSETEAIKRIEKL